jgi:hypothetical protein
MRVAFWLTAPGEIGFQGALAEPGSDGAFPSSDPSTA